MSHYIAAKIVIYSWSISGCDIYVLYVVLINN